MTTDYEASSEQKRTRTSPSTTVPTSLAQRRYVLSLNDRIVNGIWAAQGYERKSELLSREARLSARRSAKVARHQADEYLAILREFIASNPREESNDAQAVA